LSELLIKGGNFCFEGEQFSGHFFKQGMGKRGNIYPNGRLFKNGRSFEEKGDKKERKEFHFYFFGTDRKKRVDHFPFPRKLSQKGKVKKVKV
jgi:hypothetical protein